MLARYIKKYIKQIKILKILCFSLDKEACAKVYVFWKNKKSCFPLEIDEIQVNFVPLDVIVEKLARWFKSQSSVRRTGFWGISYWYLFEESIEKIIRCAIETSSLEMCPQNHCPIFFVFEIIQHLIFTHVI